MIITVLGVTALGLLLTGCNEDKSKKGPLPSSPDPSPDSENTVPFIQTSVSTYWTDLNVDGKQDSFEKVLVRPGQDPMMRASKLIRGNPWAFSPCFQWKPQFLSGEQEDYFHHPIKDRMASQLRKDVRDLKEMHSRPPIYSKLLEDLELILEELPFVLFRYPEAGEMMPGFLGFYDAATNELVASEEAPMSLLVHEMDHRLTLHRRIKDWSVPYQEKCGDQGLREVPRNPYASVPGPDTSHFHFSLDFFANGKNQFTYKDEDYWSHFYRSVALEAQACFSEEAKQAALANEVRGYLTMARYLLFQAGFTQEDMAAIRGNHEISQRKAKVKLTRGLRKSFANSDLNYRWAEEMMLHYLGIGGTDGKGNLTTFVKNYYSRNQDPGFVDPPDCQN